jgi:hypothetical protein
MLLKYCHYIWNLHSPAGRIWDEGTIQATVICDKCRAVLTVSEAVQLDALSNQTETLKHLKGFQKWQSLVALIVSIVAIAISALTYIFK